MSILGFDIDMSRICVVPDSPTKKEALNRLVDLLCQHPAVEDCEAFRRAVFDREAVASTGIGGGVAIPHVRIASIREPIIGVGIVPEGLNYASMDNNPVHIMVLFGMPSESSREYLKLLAKVMTALRNRDNFDRLAACRTPEEAAAVLNRTPPE
jgi:mannitol/fructose-specific phosphotransferase system IIA component (Ntr-type)